MAESMIAGLLRKNLVAPEQIAASHPRQNRRDELNAKYKIRVFESNAEAVETVQGNGKFHRRSVRQAAAVGRRFERIKRKVASNQIVLSIVAGAKIETISAKH